jgi:Concanavalin A-like lectin/glucanases superfamily
MSNANDDLVLYLQLDDIQSNTVLDSSSSKKNGTAAGGVSLVPDDTFGACLRFDGTDDQITVDTATFASVTNTFTLTGWVIPTTTHGIDPQATTGSTGTSGQRFMIYPPHGDETYGAGHASVGISVGTNGISVYEHAGYYLPPLLVWENAISNSDWTHIAVVYNNKTPSLYVNGQLVKTGSTSTKTSIHPSATIGGGYWGYFPGKIANVRVYQRALSVAEIQQNIAADQAGLVAHFELDEIESGNRVANAVPGIAGLVQGARLVPDDEFGACLSFDGQKDFIEVSSSDAINFGVNQNFTISVWAKSNGWTEGGTIISKGTWFEYGGAGYFIGYAAAPKQIYVGVFDTKRHIINTGLGETFGWTHFALVKQGTTIKAYVNGTEVTTGGESATDVSGTLANAQNLLIGKKTPQGDRFFKGEIANVRVYKRALSPTAINQVIDADRLALPAYRKGHPIDFSLLDENQNYALYISDDPKASHVLTLNLKNTSTQAIQFQNGKGTQATSDNYHFELVFRQGVLSAKTLTTLRQTKTDILKDPTQWDVAVSPDNRPDQTLSLYFLYKGSDQVFNQSELRQAALQNISAAAGSGMRGTQVELRLNQLVYVDDANSPMPSPITGTRVQQLQITNQSGRQVIPLHVGFVGGNRILNDGSSLNTLRLRITNTSKEALSLGQGSNQGQFIFSFDVGDVQKEWAIATATDLKPVIRATYPDGSSRDVTDVTRNQGVSPEWKIGQGTLPITKLDPNQSIEISVAEIKTNHPIGYTNLYVRYSIPGYWDGQFVCLIEKSPLLFYDASPTDRRVGIGKARPDAMLEVNGEIRAQKFTGNGAIVTGIIVMWSGKINEIPSGWALCNGQNGTPDLRSRFIMGTDANTALTDPSRKGGNLFHAHQTNKAGRHRHGFGGGGSMSLNTGLGSTTIYDDGEHEHSTIAADHLPPYFALAFIMKT